MDSNSTHESGQPSRDSESRRINHTLPDHLKPRLGSQPRLDGSARTPETASLDTAPEGTARAVAATAATAAAGAAPTLAAPLSVTASASPGSPAGSSEDRSNRAVTSMLPPTAEEVQEEFALLLEQVRQLRAIQHRGRYIAEREVHNMRRAYEFAVAREKELFGETAAGAGATYTRSSAATTADTELVELEKYVATPLSSTYENKSKGFSLESVLHTPGERRMQSILMFCLLFFTGIPISSLITVFLIYINRLTAAVMIVYLVLIFTKMVPVFPIHKNMRVARSRVFYWYRDYFPVRLVVPVATRARFDKTKNYLFAYHPHGIHGFGAIMCFGLDINETSKLLPGIRTHLQTLRVNFFIPFWRELMKWMGCGDASAACLRSTLRAGPGESIVLVVGGASESLKAKPNTNDLVLKERKGFIKIALQEGSPLVPVYGFGENNAYNVPAIASNALVQKVLRIFKKVTGFAVPLVVGRGFFFFNVGVLPYRRPIVVVVGDPVEVPKIAEPTDADIATWHEKYVEALEHLYTTHCDVYDLESTGLRVL